MAPDQPINQKPQRADHYWLHEAIAYLKLDDVMRDPRQKIWRLITKGALRPTGKIGTNIYFSKRELDRFLAGGEGKKRPGRPRKHIAGPPNTTG